MKHRLDSSEDVILRDEAHFEIKLVEFARRTIGTGVFVTKARRDLEIAIEARNHKELLEHMRRLRQRVDFTRMNVAGHTIVTRTLRRAGLTHRRMKFGEDLIDPPQLSRAHESPPH